MLQIQLEMAKMVIGFIIILLNLLVVWPMLLTWYCVVFCVFHRVFIAIVFVLLVLWLVLDTSQRPEQLISFGGVCMFIVLLFLFSAHRAMVSFHWVKVLSEMRCLFGYTCFGTCWANIDPAICHLLIFYLEFHLTWCLYHFEIYLTCFFIITF